MDTESLYYLEYIEAVICPIWQNFKFKITQLIMILQLPP